MASRQDRSAQLGRPFRRAPLGVGRVVQQQFSSSSAGYAFQADLEIPGFLYTDESGVWADRGAGPQLVARTSLPAPGLPGAVFAPEQGLLGTAAAFSQPAITAGGDVFFTANVSGPLGRGRKDGLWRQGADGVLAAVAVAGDPAPGVEVPPAGSAKLDNFEEFFANDAGQVLFRANATIDTTGEGDHSDTAREDGLWIASPGGVRLVAITQNGPEPYYASQLTPLALNDAGQAVFESFADSEDGYTLWLSATDRDGEPFEIVRLGDVIDLGPAGAPDERTVASYALLDIDGAGRVLYSVRFEDSTNALLVSDATAAPSIDGDYNGDGRVDLADYDAMRSTYGATVRVGDGADGNLNGVIDPGDYTVWRDRMVAEHATVPEPAGLVAMAAAVAATCLRRR